MKKPRLESGLSDLSRSPRWPQISWAPTPAGCIGHRSSRPSDPQKRDNSGPLVTAVDASQLLWRLVSLNFPDNFWWNVGYNPGLKEGKHHSVEKSKESRPYRALLTAFYPQEPHKLSVSVLIFKMKKPKFRKVMSLAPGNTAPEDQNLDENGAHQDMKLMSSCRIPLTGPTWILQTGFPIF